MITVEEALRIVEENISKSKSIKISLSNAHSYTLSEDVFSPIDMPPFPQSAMDGYAVNFDPSIKHYKLIGEVAAGSDKELILQNGEAVRIFTGAAVPLTANTVVRQEDVLVSSNQISFTTEVKVNMNIRPQGEQIKAGKVAISNGTYIDSATLGYLATLGKTEVEVYEKPKIAILTTGDELIKPGEKLKHGQVYESNSIMLEAAFESKGIDDVKHLEIRDVYEQTLKAIKGVMAEYDFIILSGGISVGDYDFVGKALIELGVKQHFYKVKQKPGKPLFFGQKKQTYFFALPGNPAAALTSFYVYIYPSLKQFQGGEFKGCRRLSLPLAHDYKRKAKRSEFLKGKIHEGKLSVLNAQSSAMLSSFSKADCLIYIPESVEGYNAGEHAKCLLI